MVKMVKLILDYRERKILKKLSYLNCEIEIENLKVGDILILKKKNRSVCIGGYGDSNGKAIIIERKSITDFVSSIRSKRIWEQLFKLMNTEQIMGYRIEHRILVIQQTFEEYFAQIPYWYRKNNLDKRNFWRYIINVLIDIIFVYQIPIIFLSTDSHLYDFLNILIKRDISHWHPRIFRSKMYTKRKGFIKPIKDDRLYFLSSMPNIGLTISERLLNKFNSLSGISDASVKDLQSVKGIGKKKGELIFKIFHNDAKVKIK